MIGFLLKGLGAIAFFYGLVCLALWGYQTRMMFFPDAQIRSTPADVGLSYEEVWLPVAGGQVHGWWIPNKDNSENIVLERPVVLYLHGNGSNLGDLVHRAQQFNQLGCDVMAIDYRGYGRSSGPFPSEQRVYADADAAWRYLTEQQQISARKIVIYGQSIGGAVAIDLAAEQPEAAGLIVEGSFTAMRDMVKHQKSLPFIPVNLLLTQRFDSLSKVRSLEMPLLLIHGTADEVVPVGMSQVLYDAAPKEKTRILIEGGGHSGLPDVDRDRYTDSVRRFISQVVQ